MIDHYKSAEVAKQQQVILHNTKEVIVNAVEANTKMTIRNNGQSLSMTRKCGRQHGPHKCFAYRKECQKYDKMNNFAVGCFTKDVNKRQINNIQENRVSNIDEPGYRLFEIKNVKICNII